MRSLSTQVLALLALTPVLAQTTFAQETVTASGREYREAMDLQGATVHGFQVTQIHAKLGGYVKSIGKSGTAGAESSAGKELEVDVGSRVKAKALLAKLDIPEMHDELDERRALFMQAKSAVVQAEAAVIEARAAVRQKEAGLLQVEAGTARKQATMQLAETKLQRLSVLASRGSISQDSLDEARFELAAAKAALKTIEADMAAAKANIEAAKASVTRANADVVSAKAKQDVAAAGMKHTETMMGYTTIKAPYDGIITKRMIDMGSFVQPAEKNSAATPLFEITEIDRVRIVVAVPNNRVGGIQVGQKVIFHSIGGLEGRRFEGAITRTAGALDLKTRTMKIEAHFANPAKDAVSGRMLELKPGLFGTLTVVRKDWTKENPIPVVPTTAIGKDKNGNHYVVVMSNGQPTRRFVTIGFNDAASVGISSGLSVGDKVVRSGVSRY